MSASSASTRSSSAASAGRGRAVEIEWLDHLESRVRDAVARLGELNEENRSLRDRVRDLETEVATLSIPPATPEGDGDVDEEIEALRVRVRDLEAGLAAAETERAEAAAAAKSWEVERDEVRRRVEGLTERLAGLAEG
jgi:chromosome segregation ATPase